MYHDNEFYAKLSDRKLRTCFDEINEFAKTGVLPENSLTRQTLREYIKENPSFATFAANPDEASKLVINEMARRFRHEKPKFNNGD